MKYTTQKFDGAAYARMTETTVIEWQKALR